ncbi:MAG: hypothetical protein QNJ07_16985 [Woeseiaceae bacterium]|nr:hypothetical protein [Woeseiaceae bacterium]
MSGKIVLNEGAGHRNRARRGLYYHPSREPLGHFAADMLPWMLYGNCRDDPTSQVERISAYVLDLSDGVSRLREFNVEYELPDGFRFKKAGQSETIDFFLRALEEAQFDLNEMLQAPGQAIETEDRFLESVAEGFVKLLEGRGRKK